MIKHVIFVAMCASGPLCADTSQSGETENATAMAHEVSNGSLETEKTKSASRKAVFTPVGMYLASACGAYGAMLLKDRLAGTPYSSQLRCAANSVIIPGIVGSIGVLSVLGSMWMTSKVLNVLEKYGYRRQQQWSSTPVSAGVAAAYGLMQSAPLAFVIFCSATYGSMTGMSAITNDQKGLTLAGACGAFIVGAGLLLAKLKLSQ